jgi:hypothetical protein
MHMTLLQLLATEMAGLDRAVSHIGDPFPGVSRSSRQWQGLERSPQAVGYRRPP